MITFLFNINLVQNLIKNNLDFMLPKIIKLSATNNQTLCSFTLNPNAKHFWVRAGASRVRSFLQKECSSLKQKTQTRLLRATKTIPPSPNKNGSASVRAVFIMCGGRSVLK